MNDDKCPFTLTYSRLYPLPAHIAEDLDSVAELWWTTLSEMSRLGLREMATRHLAELSEPEEGQDKAEQRRHQ